MGTEASLFDGDTRLPARPRRRPAARHDEELALGASFAMPSPPLSAALVPHFFGHGSALVGRAVSCRVAEGAARKKAQLQGYRGRTNSHMVLLREGGVVWATLTTHNCRLPRHQDEDKPVRRHCSSRLGCAALPLLPHLSERLGPWPLSSGYGEYIYSVYIYVYI